MNRKLKVFGLVAVAAFAMSAVIASAASATYHFQAINGTSPVYLTGTEHGGDHKFVTEAGTVTCTSNHFHGEASGTNGITSEATIEPTYDNCTALGFTADVIENGCHYLFTTPGTKLGTNEYTGEPPHVKCGEEAIEITPTFLGSSICTMKVSTQTPTSGHVIYRNTGGPDREMDVTVEATVEGIHYSVEGGGGSCGEEEATHTDGKYTGSVTLQGFEDEAKTNPEGITILET